MENKKENKANYEAAQWLLKPLILEQHQGFQNTAVAGGLAKWVPKVQEKLEGQAGYTPAQAAALVSHLADYAKATPEERAKKVKEVFASLRPNKIKPAAQSSGPEVATSPKAKKVRNEPVQAETVLSARETVPLDLNGPVQYLKGVGPQRARLLKQLGIETVMELLRHYPRDWQDRRKVVAIRDAKHGEMCTVCGEVRAKQTFTVRRGLNITKVILDDHTGQIAATWFNQPYMRDRFEAGQRVLAYGKVEYFRAWQMMNPDFEILEDETEDIIHTGRIVPIYPLTERLSQRVLRSVLYALQAQLPDTLPEILPAHVVQAQGFVQSVEALRAIHFPADMESLNAARRRLIFEELFLQQIAVARTKNRYQNQATDALNTNGDLLETFKQSLPFTLTDAQTRAVGEILSDLSKTRPMHRLLQGDVGSGKTIVAVLAMLAAVDSGKQTAIMAPTEVLATQHYLSLKKMLDPCHVRVELFTSGIRAAEKRQLLADLEQGLIQVAVGTHALTQEIITFRNLGLAVVDEQHRFGVEQRAMLRAKGEEPHVLVMTATPIPRTLAMTVFGDLDVTTINELPPGRMPVKTEWLPPTMGRKAYDQVKTELAQGRQAYIIFPLIDESEKIDLKALTTEHKRLTQSIFPGCSVGLMHGRLSTPEKAEVMQAFKAGKIQILAATTVVEVGVDVPNATVMVIEDADRFGLAALHQLRGRIGRGSYISYCFLLSDPKTLEGKARMKIMCTIKDGFRLAEEDLALRGPGEFFGLRQHGLPDLKLANLIRDVEQIEVAREAAGVLIAQDPEFKLPENHALQEVYKQVYGERELQALTG